MKNFDHLYKIFEKHLKQPLIKDETEDDFVGYVVEEYMQSLKSKSILPMQFIEDVKEDTCEVVYEMLLKKIYGYYNLNEFREIAIGLEIK